MSPDNVEGARRLYAFFSEGKFEEAAALSDPEVELVTSGVLPDLGTYKGREGLLALFRSFDDFFDEFHLEPDEFVARGDRVLVRLRLTGRGKHSGLVFEHNITHVLTFRNGLATSMHAYQDEDEAVAAMAQ